MTLSIPARHQIPGWQDKRLLRSLVAINNNASIARLLGFVLLGVGVFLMFSDYDPKTSLAWVLEADTFGHHIGRFLRVDVGKGIFACIVATIFLARWIWVALIRTPKMVRILRTPARVRWVWHTEFTAGGARIDTIVHIALDDGSTSTIHIGGDATSTLREIAALAPHALFGHTPENHAAFQQGLARS